MIVCTLNLFQVPESVLSTDKLISMLTNFEFYFVCSVKCMLINGLLAQCLIVGLKQFDVSIKKVMSSVALT